MIAQGQCTIFKQNLYSGLENFASETPYVYKIALYTANASLGSETTSYTSSNEVVGSGYIAGGNVLGVIPPASLGTTAYISFNDEVWTSASFVTRGALIYNSTTLAAVAVLDFGADRTTSSAGVFTLTFPPPTATTAVIRNT